VVPDLSGVVEDATGRGLDDAFQILAFELGARDQVVQIGHVSSVVLVVVKLERLGGHVRLESVLFVRQRRQFESHDVSPTQVSRIDAASWKERARRAGDTGEQERMCVPP